MTLDAFYDEDRLSPGSTAAIICVLFGASLLYNYFERRLGRPSVFTRSLAMLWPLSAALILAGLQAIVSASHGNRQASLAFAVLATLTVVVGVVISLKNSSSIARRSISGGVFVCIFCAILWRWAIEYF